MRILISWSYGGLAFLTVLTAVAMFFGADQGVKDLPAWVQAVGSVLAIITVFWINALNQSKEQLARNQSIQAIAKTAYEFASAIRADLKKIAAEKHPNFDSSIIRSVYDPEISRSYGKALANLPFHEAGSTEVVQALFFLQAQFSVLLPKSINELLSGPAVHGVVSIWGSPTDITSFMQEKIPPLIAQIDDIENKWEIVRRGLS